MLFRKKKSLEDNIVAAIRAEFARITAEIRRDRREYRRRSEAKEQARAAVDGVQAQAQRLHLEGVTLKERFWESYYGEDEAALTEIERDSNPSIGHS